ncbi:hypothetical protein RchiOBHm_Chr5g0033661 [Rosa chinensis]|uniref:HD-Zip IV C-terminal domain-containing protein n=1 Tax=Rosa chinensis TaxID=74649 RepID=A0A2P6QAU3_ROSCH|nr:hypothetical protein RchiOBHm_Chr5g0033661 [Rosa chinensis]
MPVSRSAAIHCKPWYRLTRITDVANSDSLFNAKCLDINNNYYMLMFQETRTDASGSAVVYALITSTSSDIMMDAVYEGGDSTYVNLLPSGFAILPCGTSDYAKGEGNGSDDGECLLTVGFRVVCDGGQPTSKLTMLSVKTKLISSPPAFRRSELALQINDGP